MNSLVDEATQTLERLQRRLQRCEEQQRPYAAKKLTAWAALEGRRLYLVKLIELAERRLARRKAANDRT